MWDVPVEEQKAVLDEAYHQAMIILFRMLFVAYAEDRELLPLGVNDAYTANALNTLASRMLDDPDKGFSETSTSLWNDLTQIWDVIDTGDLEGMGVPAYNGGLFTQDKKKNPSGAATYKLRLTSSEIGPVIRGLMIDITADGIPGLVDFRSLDVREFGTIYEGLLESGLAIADTDLTVDSQDTFIPAKKGDEVVVEAGSVYFHSRSGSRKATGSYFTKPFAVQHLLDQALEPALDTHLDKIKSLLGKGANQTAAESLFDFRVADLSMGSAHFLVAAIDRIEARFSAFIAENPMPEVQDELHKLRTTAATQLGLSPEDSGIDDGVLLRRQIARRCIYGVDLNELAVELARLAMWIHTFVPGLPLSFLNHGLIHGNSLTGVGTIQEITDSIREAQEREDKNHQSGYQEFDTSTLLEELLTRADNHLATLATLTGASISEVQQVQDLYQEVTQALEPLTALCDLITAERTTRKLKLTDPDKFLLIGGKNNNLTYARTADELEQAILKHPQLQEARGVARRIHATHLPTAFPEVFRREPSGFDVILGNPPWEKLKVEVSRWWALHFPGLRSLEQHEQDVLIEGYRKQRLDLVDEYEQEVAETESMRESLISGPYPGIGRGDLDLYKAFAWRFAQVSRTGGYVGVVVPRSLLSEKGTAPWRAYMFDHAEWLDVTLLLNSARWAFDMEPRWTIALLSVCMTDRPSEFVHLRGPANSLTDFTEVASEDAVTLPAQEYRQWGEGDAFRILSTPEAGRIYQQMMKFQPLGSVDRPWRFRPFAEFHSTADKPLMDLTSTGQGDGLPVYKGESFNLWQPDTGTYYAHGESDLLLNELQRRREKGSTSSRSPFSEFETDDVNNRDTLPALNPRIAFRKISSRTNNRTIIAALVPPSVTLSDGAPYLLRPQGNAQDESFVLGVLSSIPLDWAARNVVEVNVNYPQVNSLPIPDPGPGHAARDRIVEISGRLAAIDERYSAWAKDVGVPVGSVKTPEEKDALIAELDALVSLLYGLSREQVEQVFATFHRGWDYKPRLAAVLAHYDAWSASLSEGE